MVYNHLKEKVKTFLQPFAESGQAVGAEDIKAYFEKLRGDETGVEPVAENYNSGGGAGGEGGGAEGGGGGREQSGRFPGHFTSLPLVLCFPPSSVDLRTARLCAHTDIPSSQAIEVSKAPSDLYDGVDYSNLLLEGRDARESQLKSSPALQFIDMRYTSLHQCTLLLAYTCRASVTPTGNTNHPLNSNPWLPLHLYHKSKDPHCLSHSNSHPDPRANPPKKTQTHFPLPTSNKPFPPHPEKNVFPHFPPPPTPQTPPHRDLPITIHTRRLHANPPTSIAASRYTEERNVAAYQHREQPHTNAAAW